MILIDSELAFARLGSCWRALRIVRPSASLIACAMGSFLLGTVQADDGKVRYINDWKWEGQTAPLLLALDEGYFADENLDVTLEPGTGSVDAIPKVASGEFEMGAADINSLITWRAEHPDVDLKAVYIIYNAPPFAVIGRPSLGVTGPLDLEGHTLGAPVNDGAFAQWPAFVRANGIIAERVTIEDIGFPVREPLLADGEVDAITGFSFTSMVSLEAKGVPPEDLSLMLMSDFGLDLYGNAIIVNPEFAAERPDDVKAFLRAAVRGFQQTIRNPAAAVQYPLKRSPDAEEATELKRLVMAIGHHIATEEVSQIGLGAVVEPRLEKSIAQLAEMHDFADIPAAADVFDDSYLPELGSRLLPNEDEQPLVTPLPDDPRTRPLEPGVLDPSASESGPADAASAGAEADRSTPDD